MIRSHSATPNRVCGAQRRAHSLLLAIFVLSLVGVTLMSVGAHFRATMRYAQSARLEAQVAQILHSGLAWAKNHELATPPDVTTAPIVLNTAAIAGPGATSSLTLAWNAERGEWQLTARLERGRHRITRSLPLRRETAESGPSNSR